MGTWSKLPGASFEQSSLTMIWCWSMYINVDLCRWLEASTAEWHHTEFPYAIGPGFIPTSWSCWSTYCRARAARPSQKHPAAIRRHPKSSAPGRHVYHPVHSEATQRFQTFWDDFCFENPQLELEGCGCQASSSKVTTTFSSVFWGTPSSAHSHPPGFQTSTPEVWERAK